jgi:hypothetical protein
MGKNWNKDDHKPVIDQNGAGGPSTKKARPSGDGRARVEPQPKPAPHPKKPK